MTRTNQIGVGVGVLVVLGGLAYMQNKKDDAIGTTQKTSAELPTIAGVEDVDKISITSEKGEYVLVKDGDKWMLDKPLHALANQNNVKQLVDNMKELKATEVVA